MPDASITNPGGVWGAPVNTGKRTIPMINGSTTTVNANSIVQLSTSGGTSPTTQTFIPPTLSLTNNTIIGVLDADTAAGAVGDVCVDGFHLIAVSSVSIPAINDQLAVSTTASQSTTITGTPILGLAKTSTASSVLVGQIIGVCVSTSLDSFVNSSTNVGVFVPAYIHKM